MLKVVVTYLRHTGGTKFYETVLAYDDDFDLAILIKRYGANTKFLTGEGQTICEAGLVGEMKSANAKILDEKRKQRAGERYSDHLSAYGLGPQSGANMSAERFREEVLKHYSSDNSILMNNVVSFVEKLGQAEMDVDHLFNRTKPIKAAPPVPEPVRDASWGSW